jgi:hypothetical protein
MSQGALNAPFDMPAIERARYRAQMLGQHEIATIQTISIDQTAGFINLTTVLAESWRNILRERVIGCPGIRHMRRSELRLSMGFANSAGSP